MGGGGGGGSQPTEQTVYSTDLPEYVEPYFKRLLQRGEADSLQGYTPYGGQRLAYFSPDELTSQAMTRGFATSGTPQQFTDATARYGATSAITPQYTAGAFNPNYQGRQITSSYLPNVRQSEYIAGDVGSPYRTLGFEDNLQRFMSPYQQGVTDIAKREAIRTSNIAGKGISDAATLQGGLGGYREAIQQSERERNLGQRLDDIQITGGQRAYEAAQRQLAAERAAGLGEAQFGLQQFQAGEAAEQTQEKLMQAAYMASEQAKQQAAKLGLTADQQTEASRQAAAKFGLTAQQLEDAARQQQEKFAQSAYDLSNRYNLAAAQGLMGTGETISRDALARISALQGIGSQQRALQQASLDLGYEDFQRQRDYAQSQLGLFSNILRGVPVQPQQRISTFQQQPGLFQQAVGAGLTGLGLYRGMS
tara:strand:+ start:987 stop:2249 length:1263 start_codon:yes stop_codon:yes gene_type:complete